MNYGTIDGLPASKPKQEGGINDGFVRGVCVYAAGLGARSGWAELCIIINLKLWPSLSFQKLVAAINKISISQGNEPGQQLDVITLR
jgi:hypothetical protein